MCAHTGLYSDNDEEYYRLLVFIAIQQLALTPEEERHDGVSVTEANRFSRCVSNFELDSVNARFRDWHEVGLCEIDRCVAFFLSIMFNGNHAQ